MDQTLYHKYGGFSQISRIVLALYDKILDDDDIGPFFDDVDMGKVVDHQTKFVSSLMGGPASYSDEQIKIMHAHLDINPMHFDVLSRILASTLQEFGVEPQDIAIIANEFEIRRSLVVEK